jgi:hypothetical protein
MGKSFKRSRDDYEDDDYIDLHIKKKNDIREKRKQKQEQINHLGDDNYHDTDSDE